MPTSLPESTHRRDVAAAAERALARLRVDGWMMAGVDPDVCRAVVRLGRLQGLDVRLWNGGDLGTEITLGGGPDDVG